MVQSYFATIATSKIYPTKFSIRLRFETNEEFANLYINIRHLNLDVKFSKTTRCFYAAITQETVVGLIRLRAAGFTVEFDSIAGEMFNDLRDAALAEIQIRKQEAAVISRLKEIGKLTLINVKSCEPKLAFYNHQKFLYLLATRVRKVAFWSDPGTGKSAPAILAAEYRVKQKQVKKCLVICPNNLSFKWATGIGNEIQKHSHLDGMVLEGNQKQRIQKIKQFLMDPTKTFLVTTYSFWSGRKLGRHSNRNDEEYELLMGKGKVQMFICDESHRMKNPSALTSQNLLKWLPNCKYGICMSGTPQPQSRLDIFQQIKVLDPSIFGTDFYRFRQKYFRCFDPWGSQWTIKSNRHKDVLMQKAEQKALIYSVDECLDLPREINEKILIYQNDDYLRELRNLSEEHVRAAMDSGNMGGGLLFRLLTACSGFSYSKDALGNRMVREFKTNPKAEALQALCENIHAAGKKAIIWVTWQHDFVIIKRLLDSLNFTYISIDHTDDKKARYDKTRLYDNSPKIPFLLSSPKLISEGFDIYSAGYSIYYSYAFDFLPIVQSKARNRRMGSKEYHSSITYYTLCVHGSVEESALSAFQDKKSIKDAMFGACQDIINKIRQFRGNSCKKLN